MLSRHYSYEIDDFAEGRPQSLDAQWRAARALALTAGRWAAPTAATCPTCSSPGRRSARRRAAADQARLRPDLEAAARRRPPRGRPLAVQGGGPARFLRGLVLEGGPGRKRQVAYVELGKSWTFALHGAAAAAPLPPASSQALIPGGAAPEPPPAFPLLVGSGLAAPLGWPPLLLAVLLVALRPAACARC